ncbi:hypothetical protein C8J56DRAFT_891223 [Mycena floridula]|nr:hypothetical protein C8J56DRAFT_891223 [Mycena floridula]
MMVATGDSERSELPRSGSNVWVRDQVPVTGLQSAFGPGSAPKLCDSVTRVTSSVCLQPLPPKILSGTFCLNFYFSGAPSSVSLKSDAVHSVQGFELVVWLTREELRPFWDHCLRSLTSFGLRFVGAVQFLVHNVVVSAENVAGCSSFGKATRFVVERDQLGRLKEEFSRLQRSRLLLLAFRFLPRELKLDLRSQEKRREEKRKKSKGCEICLTSPSSTESLTYFLKARPSDVLCLADSIPGARIFSVTEKPENFLVDTPSLLLSWLVAMAGGRATLVVSASSSRHRGFASAPSTSPTPDSFSSVAIKRLGGLDGFPSAVGAAI